MELFIHLHQTIWLAILFHGFFIQITLCYRFEPNTLVLKNYSVCPVDKHIGMLMNLNYKEIARNKYLVNGDVIAKDPIVAPLQLQLNAKRCDFNQTQCESFNIISIPDICKIMNMQDQMWSDFMANTQPKVQCPCKPTTIKVTNASVDAGYISHFPLEGYMWTFNIKLHKRVGHKAILLACVLFDMVATKNLPNRRNSSRASKTGLGMIPKSIPLL